MPKSSLERLMRFIIIAAIGCGLGMSATWLAIEAPAQVQKEERYTIEMFDENDHIIKDANGEVLVQLEAGGCPSPEVGSTRNLLLLLANPEAREDGNGAMRIPCPSGKCQVQTRVQTDGRKFWIAGVANGYTSDVQPLGKSSSIRFRLDRVPDVFISVENESGKPVQNARLRLLPLSRCYEHLKSFDEYFIPGATTDLNGSATFKSIPDGTYLIGIQRNGQLVVSAEPVRVAADDRDYVLYLRELDMKPYLVTLPPYAGKEDRAMVIEYRSTSDTGVFVSAQAAPNQTQLTLMIPGGDATPRDLFGIRRDGSVFRVLNATGNELPGRVGDRPEGKSSSQFLWSKSRILMNSVAEVDTREIKVSNFGKLIGNKLIPPATMIGASGFGFIQFSQIGTDGKVSLPAGQTLYGDVSWTPWTPIAHAILRISSGNELICEVMTSSSGDFICSYLGAQLAPTNFSVLLEGKIIYLENSSNTGLMHLSPRSLQEKQSWVGIEEEKTGKTINDVTVWTKYKERNSGDDGFIESRLYAHAQKGRIPADLIGSRSSDASVGYPDSSTHEMQSLNTVIREYEGSARIQLHAQGSIAGTLLEKGSKNPIEAAQIQVKRNGGGYDLLRIGRRALTDSSGRWKMGSLPRGNYKIAAYAPGHRRESFLIDVIPGNEIALQRELIPVGALRGEVSGLSRNATVNVLILGDGKQEGEAQRLGNLEDYEFGDIPVGEYAVQASVVPGDDGKTGLQLKKVTISAGNVSRADFEFDSGLALSGQAFLGKEVVKSRELGFELATSGKDLIYKPVRTDSEGHFTVILPQTGDYTASISEKNDRGGGKSTVTVIVTSAKKQRTDLHFPIAGLTGKVGDQAGKPLGHARIRLWSISESNRSIVGAGGTHSRLVMDVANSPDGSFLIVPIAYGSYQLEIEAKGFKNKLVGPIILEKDVIEELPEINMDSSSTILVRVVGQLGDAIAGVAVVAFEGGDLLRPGYPPSGISGDDGNVRLKGIGEGRYTIVAMAKGFAPGFLEIDRAGREEPGDLPREIVMNAGSPLEIVALDNTGKPKEGVRIGIRDSTGRDVTRIYENLALISNEPTETNSEGSLRLPSVTMGQYYIFFLDSERSSTQIVAVGNGDSSEARILVFESPKK